MKKTLRKSEALACSVLRISERGFGQAMGDAGGSEVGIAGAR